MTAEPTKHTSPRPIQILLVEDNKGDVMLTKRAFSQAQMPVDFQVAMTGEEALERLHSDTPTAPVLHPDIILLDLNLPFISGCEVLDRIKHDPALKHIPVIMLTSSKAESDVMRCYQSHANSYLVKPSSQQQFATIVKAVENFWFNHAVLPQA